MIDIVWVTAASGLAGFLDAIVGGGGLVLVPALFAAFPSAPPASLFGTNKAASIWGTAWAARSYVRRVSLDLTRLWPAFALALLGSLLGAWMVTRVDGLLLRRSLPFILSTVLIYTLTKKDLGQQHAPKFDRGMERLFAGVIGAVVGWYDGFFGPGTGSFFVFLFVRALGYDFLHASASAKLLNTATNFAALMLFAWSGHVWWPLAAGMAVANVLGSSLGTHMALRHGTGFVRVVFMLVVAALILRSGFDAWRS